MIHIQELLQRLDRVRVHGDGWTARCPAHEDKNPSLSIDVGEDARILLHCFAKCSPESICEALGVTFHDLFPEGPAYRPPATRTSPTAQRSNKRKYASAEDAAAAALYGVRKEKGEDWVLRSTFTYWGMDGTEKMRVLRFESKDGKHKTFRPIHVVGGSWFIGDPAGRLPLYRLQDLRPGMLTYVFEGEKVVELARSCGLIAVTSAHGAGSAHMTDWMPLAGREVVIVLDNDDAGRSYADEVARALTQLDRPAKVRIVALPGLPAKADFVDFHDRLVEEGLEQSQVVARLEGYVRHAPIVELVDGQLQAAYTPFPVHVLPEVFVRFVSVSAKALGCDPAYVALPLLAVCASAIGHSRAIMVKPRWVEPAVLWAIIIGESGTLKSPALDLALTPLRELQKEAFRRNKEEMQRYEKELAEYERDVRSYRRASGEEGVEAPDRPIQPKAARLIVGDTTIEALASVLEANAHGVLLCRDELSGWFASFDRYANNKGGDVAFWLEVHGARSILIDRKSGDRKSIFIPRALVSIAGGIQPAVLARSLSRSNIENGLAARFLMAMPPRRKKEWSEVEVDQATLSLLTDTVYFLHALLPNQQHDGHPTPKECRFSPAGRKKWIEFFEEHAELQAHATGHEAAALSKLEAAVPRLALVIHEVRFVSSDSNLVSEDEVDEISVQSAVDLVRWLRNENRRIYSMLNRETGEDKTSLLRARIEQAGGTVSIREWQRIRSHRTSTAAKQELQHLADAGHGDWESQPRKPKGRAPDPSFVLRRPASDATSPAVDTSDRSDTDTSDGRSKAPPVAREIPPDELNGRQSPDSSNGTGGLHG